MTKAKIFLMVGIVLVMISSSALAQTVTVNSGGGADYATVQAALDAVSANAATPDVVNIIGGGPYDEVITITAPVTLQGSSYRPVLAVRLNAGSPSAGDDGLVVNTPGDVTLNNLIVIPSRTSTPTDDGIIVNPQTGPSLNLTMTDILICPNNGADLPVTNDGLTLVNLTGATQFGDDGMYLSSGAGIAVTANLTRVISTQNRGAGPNSNNDGFVIAPSSTAVNSINFLEGCVASFNNRIGIQWGGGGATINVNGTKANPVLVIGNGQAVITSGGCTVYNGTGTINYCIMRDGLNAGVAAITSATPGGSGLTSVSNCIIANNGRRGIDSADSSAAGRVANIAVSDVTLFNNTPDQINNSSTVQGLNISDTILAGSGKTGINNTGNAITIDYSALVNAGPHALTTLVTGAGTTTVGGNVINADPQFVSTDPTSGGFLDVASSSYETAGTGGSHLVGGADWAGATPTLTPIGYADVSKDWALYW